MQWEKDKNKQKEAGFVHLKTQKGVYYRVRSHLSSMYLGISESLRRFAGSGSNNFRKSFWPRDDIGLKFFGTLLVRFRRLASKFWTNLIIILKQLKPHSLPPVGFYWSHQCSWTLTTANSMQVSITPSDNRHICFSTFFANKSEWLKFKNNVDLSLNLTYFENMSYWISIIFAFSNGFKRSYR